MIGIYKIENLVNGKVYIGQSINFKRRFSEHLTELRNNKHANQYLQASWNKYGEHNFKISILELCDIDNLEIKENYWINYYGGVNSDNTYNLKAGGLHGHLSEISKQKLSIKAKAIHHKPLSSETKQKLSLALKGKKAWNKGLHISEKQKEQISKANLGRKHTELAKQQISNTMKNYVKTEEHKKHLSESKKGKPLSEKHKQALKDAWVRRKLNKFKEEINNEQA